MATPNDHLRLARERSASRRHPNECLSRQELAELVNDHLWLHFGVRVEIDDTYIGKLERGVIRWPGERYRQALCSILHADNETQLGFRNSRRTAIPDQHSGIAPSTDAAWPTVIPTRVDERHVAETRSAATMFTGWHRQHGGWSLREAALAQMRWAEQLLRVPCRERVRVELNAAVAELAHACAFMAFDTCEHALADRYFDVALRCSRESGDRKFRAFILHSMARHAVWLGRFEQAHTFVEHALTQTDRLLPAERANLHTALAVTLAGMNRAAEARRAIGMADDAFELATQPASPWERFYTPAQHYADTSGALVMLVERGHRPGDARSRLIAASTHLTPESRRTKSLVLLKLASLAVYTGAPDEGVAIATSALAQAEEIRSSRIARETDSFAELLSHRADPEFARKFCDQRGASA